MPELLEKKKELQQINAKLHLISDEYRYQQGYLDELLEEIKTLREKQKVLSKEINKENTNASYI